MSLRGIKKRLNIEQRSIHGGTVVTVGKQTAVVRLANGQQRRCIYPEASAPTVGQAVRVETDGSSYSISGDGVLAELAGELIVKL